MNTTSIGQRILAAVLAHQLGISADRALKLYVQGKEIDPRWEQIGATLLRDSLAVNGTARVPNAPAEREAPTQ